MGFLSQLGDKFLAALYRTIVAADDALLLVAVDEKETVLGFISGCIETSALYKYFVKEHGARVMVTILTKIVNPSTLKRLLETATYPLREQRLPTYLPKAELLSIAIAEGYRGRGIGKMLFNVFAGSFKEKGVNSFKIVVGAELTEAPKFYGKVGCELVADTEIHQGEKSRIYVYSSINKQAANL